MKTPAIRINIPFFGGMALIAAPALILIAFTLWRYGPSYSLAAGTLAIVLAVLARVAVQQQERVSERPIPLTYSRPQFPCWVKNSKTGWYYCFSDEFIAADDTDWLPHSGKKPDEA